MKKIFIMIMALGLMLAPASTVMAGGDQHRGTVGKGETNENGCEYQPCFADAPQTGGSAVLYRSVSDPAIGLDQAEIDHLLFIREEEKLARDVYRVLSEKWGNPVFAKIAESEQAHMDAMAKLLAFYGIDDPVPNDEIGVFNDPNIGALFTWLSGLGSQSERDALLVGGYIEEYDILDIWKAYQETDEERIQRVYQNLYEGSYNHLHAFVYNFQLLTGETYTAQLLEKAQYDLVMAFETKAKQAQGPKQRKGK